MIRAIVVLYIFLMPIHYSIGQQYPFNYPYKFKLKCDETVTDRFYIINVYSCQVNKKESVAISHLRYTDKAVHMTEKGIQNVVKILQEDIKGPIVNRRRSLDKSTGYEYYYQRNIDHKNVSETKAIFRTDGCLIIKIKYRINNSTLVKLDSIYYIR